VIVRLFFSLFRLGTMGLNWKDIPAEVKGMIESALVRHAGEFNRIEVGGLLKAFMLLDYHWCDDEEIRKTFFSSFCVIFRKEGGNSTDMVRTLSDCVYYFGKTGIQWNELPSEVEKTLLGALLRYSKLFNAYQLNRVLEG
jgi:hypothetical protein